MPKTSTGSLDGQGNIIKGPASLAEKTPSDVAQSSGEHEVSDEPKIPSNMSYDGPTDIRVYRAAADDYVNSDSTAFAEEKESALKYLDNPGYGGGGGSDDPELKKIKKPQ